MFVIKLLTPSFCSKAHVSVYLTSRGQPGTRVSLNGQLVSEKRIHDRVGHMQSLASLSNITLGSRKCGNAESRLSEVSRLPTGLFTFKLTILPFTMTYTSLHFLSPSPSFFHPSSHSLHLSHSVASASCCHQIHSDPVLLLPDGVGHGARPAAKWEEPVRSPHGGHCPAPYHPSTERACLEHAVPCPALPQMDSTSQAGQRALWICADVLGYTDATTCGSHH